MKTKLSAHFAADELACKHCGKTGVKPELVEVLESLREKVGPIIVNSGYRCPQHPVEAAKLAPGFHAKGLAADIRPASAPLRALYDTALAEPRIKGIGVDRAQGYIHVDVRPGNVRSMWTYKRGRAVVVADPWPRK